MYVGVGPPPPPRHGRKGSPSPNPPPGTATKEGEGGVGQMGFHAIPPPPAAKQFSSRPGAPLAACLWSPPRGGGLQKGLQAPWGGGAFQFSPSPFSCLPTVNSDWLSSARLMCLCGLVVMLQQL